MKKLINKKTFIALTLIIAILLTAACGSTKDKTSDASTAETKAVESEASNSGEKALEDGVLDLGTNAAFPPYEYYEGEDIVGIDAEIAEAIANYLGYEYKIHDMEFANIIASIESGKVDGGIAGMTVNAERLESVNFSDSYATGIQSIIVTKDSDIESIDDLEGKKIGTQFGTTGDTYARDDYDDDFVQSFDKGADAVIALLAGNIDCVIIDNEPAKNFVKTDDNLQLLDTDYAVEDYAIALPKDNAALLDEINGALKALKEDGTIPAIIEKYIPAE